MMVLVRRMKSYDPDGLFIGVFSAGDRMSLFMAIDEFCDPSYCEFYVVPNSMSFLLNNFTSKEYEGWFDNLEINDDTQEPPEVQIDNISGDLFSQEMFKDGSLWQPLVQAEEKGFDDWYDQITIPNQEELFNLEIG